MCIRISCAKSSCSRPSSRSASGSDLTLLRGSVFNEYSDAAVYLVVTRSALFENCAALRVGQLSVAAV